MNAGRPLLAPLAGAAACLTGDLIPALVLGAAQIFLLRLHDPKFGSPLEHFLLVVQLALIEAAICGAGFALATAPSRAWRTASLRYIMFAGSLAGAAAFIAGTTGVAPRLIRMLAPDTLGALTIEAASAFLSGFVAGLLASLARLVFFRGRTMAT